MAFAPVNLQAEIWKAVGLSHILMPAAFKADTAPIPEIKSYSRNCIPPRTPQKAAPQTPPLPETDERPGKRENEWKALPVENWPLVWQEQLKKTKRASFAWTYLELGNDLANAGANRNNEQEDLKRSRRGNFLRSLFRDLAFPPGSHCLWPISLSQGSEGGERLEHDLFWSGIGKLDCRGVIVFGSAAARIAFPDASLKPLSCFCSHGALAVVLWDINALAEREGMHAEVTEYLRSCLRQICGN